MNREQRERHEGYEQREAGQTNFSRFSCVSRLKILWTLRFRNINREQRERYEQRLLLSRLSVHSLEGRGTLLLGLFLEPHWNYKGHSLLVRSKVSGDTPYLFAVFASFAVEIFWNFRNIISKTICCRFWLSAGVKIKEIRFPGGQGWEGSLPVRISNQLVWEHGPGGPRRERIWSHTQVRGVAISTRHDNLKQKGC